MLLHISILLVIDFHVPTVHAVSSDLSMIVRIVVEIGPHIACLSPSLKAGVDDIHRCGNEPLTMYRNVIGNGIDGILLTVQLLSIRQNLRKKTKKTVNGEPKN